MQQSPKSHDFGYGNLGRGQGSRRTASQFILPFLGVMTVGGGKVRVRLVKHSWPPELHPRSTDSRQKFAVDGKIPPGATL